MDFEIMLDYIKLFYFFIFHEKLFVNTIIFLHYQQYKFQATKLKSLLNISTHQGQMLQQHKTTNIISNNLSNEALTEDKTGVPPHFTAVAEEEQLNVNKYEQSTSEIHSISNSTITQPEIPFEVNAVVSAVHGPSSSSPSPPHSLL